MEEKANKRVAKTKEMLKSALTELLKVQSFDRISVKGICEKAGVNRSTFYVHYSCPRDLIDEMEKDILNHLPKVESKEPKDIVASFSRLMEYVKNNSSVVEVLMRDGVDNSFGETLMRAVMDKYNKYLLINDDAEMTRRCYIFCITGAIGIVRDWIDKGFSYSTEEIAETIIELAFNVMGVNNISLHA